MIDRHPCIEPMHPGELLREDILPALDMGEQALANALQISCRTLSEILNEEQSITPDMAVRFGKLFANGSRFWVNLQCTFDQAIATPKQTAAMRATPEPGPS